MPLRPVVTTADGGAAALEPAWLARRKLAVRGALALFARRVLPVLVFVLFPLLLTANVLWLAVTQDSFALDFHHAFWPAARDVLAGMSPFPPATHAALAGGTAFVYPPPAAFLVAPFALLPLAVADVAFTALLVLTVVATLRVAGVRDWRVYGVAFLWPPVFSSLQAATLSLLLAFGLAVLWRVRDRALAAGAAVAVIVSLKLFLWPVVVWLVATRRYRAAAWAAVLAPALTLGLWAILGFAGLTSYPRLLHILTDLEQNAAYTPLGFALRLGVPFAAAHWLGLALAAAVLGASVWAVRAGRGDARGLALATMAALLFSPVVWLHYFVVLLVPTALLRPRLTPVWLLPLALSTAPARPDGPSWFAGVALAAFGLLLALAWRPPAPIRIPATLAPGTGRIRLVA